MTDRVPPHDHEAERAVLGGLLLEPEAIGLVRDLPLAVGEFYRDAHGLIFDAIMELAADGAPVDSITLRGKLVQSGTLVRAGGDEYLLGLTDTIPTVANIVAHAKIVKEKALVRRMIHACYEQIARGYGDYGDAADYVAHAEKAVADVAKSRPSDGDTQTIHAAAWEAAALLRHSSEPTLYRAPRTGFAILDYALKAMPRQTMTVIGGRTGCCKSTLMLAAALDQARNQGHTVGIVSLEDASPVWGARALSFVAPINGEEIIDSQRRSGGERDAMIAHAMLGLEKLESYGVHLAYALNRPLTDVLAAIRKLVGKHGCTVIYVDYLQAVAGINALGNSRREGIGEALQRIKGECQRLDTTLIVASQLARPGSENSFREPFANELKESGDIENMAEAIVLLWKTSDDENATIMGKVAKVKWTARRPCFRIEQNAYGAITALHEMQRPKPRSTAGEYS